MQAVPLIAWHKSFFVMFEALEMSGITSSIFRQFAYYYRNNDRFATGYTK
jgi:hypothetical protein